MQIKFSFYLARAICEADRFSSLCLGGAKFRAFPPWVNRTASKTPVALMRSFVIIASSECRLLAFLALQSCCTQQDRRQPVCTCSAGEGTLNCFEFLAEKLSPTNKSFMTTY